MLKRNVSAYQLVACFATFLWSFFAAFSACVFEVFIKEKTPEG